MYLVKSDLPAVIVEYSNCEAGWITMKVSCGGQSVHIDLSHVFDPLPDLVHWLEAILTGVMECSFNIDEEGTWKKLSAQNNYDGSVSFEITELHSDIDANIQVRVERRQLVSAFYNELLAFYQSSEYDPEEWEAETLQDRLLESSGWSVDEVVHYLASINREKLEDVFFKLAPSYRVEWPAEKDTAAQFSYFVEHVLHPDDKEKQLGMKKVEEHWEIDETYDQWDKARKIIYLTDYIQEKVPSYDGAKLQDLRSSRIEQYLGINKQGDIGK